MPTTYTPMMEQYLAIKARVKDAILFFRLGDFYEMFFEDAKVASKILDLTLTGRDAGQDVKVPMCGIPYHAAENYINRLVRSGRKVAICEQVEDPKTAKGVVKREVVRTITPGTTLSQTMLEQKDNNYVCAVHQAGAGFGVAWVDVSTGEFFVSFFKNSGELLTHLDKLQIREVILPEGTDRNPHIETIVTACAGKISYFDPTCFIPEFSSKILAEHFRVQTLEGIFGKDTHPAILSAAGAAIAYLKDTHKDRLGHINGVKIFEAGEFAAVDSTTERNLELVRNKSSEGREHTLLWVIDETLTAMGGRLLKNRILNPLRERSKIDERLDAVQAMVDKIELREKVRNLLGEIQDLERIAGRLECGWAHARDLIGLATSLRKVSEFRGYADLVRETPFENLFRDLPQLTETIALIENAIYEDPPVTLKDGRLIKKGFSAQLDELKAVSGGGKEWIRHLQEKEIERTGIKSLKVRYNKVFGYYIEITKTNLSAVPEDYIRKQTLVNAERYITPELKEKEALVLGAEEKIVNLEFELFIEVRNCVREKTGDIQNAAKIVALMDVAAGLAHGAVLHRYVRPEIRTDEIINVEDGRHPVIERLMGEVDFVPNNTCFSDEERLLIITGPNMAGKSTYIRQVALTILLAQAGCFVPAKKASIGLVDRIFTRVGASDELSRGQSTFMVEMVEVANILHHATSKSLIILDEVGRGTSTFDGVSIAWAVAEYIHDSNRLGARTLFATHYHELTELALLLPRVKNYSIAVKEWNDDIIFLRKIIPEGTDKSYGIHVARLAGLPRTVIERAKDILANLEKASLDDKGLPAFAGTEEGTPSSGQKKPADQLTFFAELKNPVIEKLKEADVNNMTPMQALQFLENIKKEISAENREQKSEVRG